MSGRIDRASAPPARGSEAQFERTFVTPEGVDLRLSIAEAGERATAFVLDVCLCLAALIGLTVLAFAAAGVGQFRALEPVAIVWMLGAFLIRNGYFIGFELSAAAATPGKRRLGLRVASRDGGPLTANAVFARNIMRELEVFVPLVLLFGGGGDGVDAAMRTLALIWASVFLLLPLFNRDRLRAGDLIAGTMVVKSPRPVLESDLAETSARPPELVFAPAQLDAYGVKELHVLEEVLRRRDRKTMAAVRERIGARIGLTTSPDLSDADVLAAYYAGLRGRLETRMLFGHRRRDKHDQP